MLLSNSVEDLPRGFQRHYPWSWAGERALQLISHTGQELAERALGGGAAVRRAAPAAAEGGRGTGRDGEGGGLGHG